MFHLYYTIKNSSKIIFKSMGEISDIWKKTTKIAFTPQYLKEKFS